MMITWWWLWIAVMFFIIFLPLGYGWGYRGWGPPYPRYVQRRRSDRATRDGVRADFNHHAWGWGGDFLWVIMFIWVVWFFTAFWVR